MSASHETPAAAGSNRDREIVAARVIATCPGRNFVTLKIETRSGVVGIGDATLNGRELAVRFPYSPKQLPIARLEDGSMWNW